MSKIDLQMRQYLTLMLGNECFAIDVAHVREILELSEITQVPDAPAYMRGVVNVRGQAVPVVDLRLKFGLPSIVDTLHTRIVVLEIELDGETTVVGGLTDSVREVIELDHAQTAPAPSIAMRWKSEIIKGMARRADQFVIVLDIISVFASDASLRIEPALDLR